MITSLFPDREALARRCLRHHSRKLSLFGSTQKGGRRPDSDVDPLAEFRPGRQPGLIGSARMEAELSTLLGGRKADLRTPSDLSRYFREEIRRTALVQYAA